MRESAEEHCHLPEGPGEERVGKETRKVGRAKMYKIDLRNPVVRKFIELDDAICGQYASQIEKQEVLAD